MAEQARIDKWLWAVRIYKTRSIAAEACKKGHVSIGDRTAKPAHNIRVGDIVNVKKAPVTYSFRVLKCAENRVGAKLVPELMENITSQEESFKKYTVVGTACESTDVFDENISLRKSKRGDLLTIKSAGAYGRSMASEYNMHELPKAVYSDQLNK